MSTRRTSSRCLGRLVLAGLLLSGSAAAQGIVAAPEAREGEPLLVQALDEGMPVRGVAVQGTWWPGAEDASLSRAGTTDAQGRLEWVPGRSGVVALQGEGRPALVRVQPESTDPVAWILLLLLALAPPLALLRSLSLVSRRWLRRRAPRRPQETP